MKIQKVKNISDIIKYLNLGTSLPVWEEFHKYIKSDLSNFEASSYILQEGKKQSGHVLIFYREKDNTLYFGFFKTLENDVTRIEFLLNKLIEFAKKNNFKTIRGPINIPTIIYGWGFMKEGSADSLFIGKPVNSPDYIEIFLKKGFILKTSEISPEGPIPKLSSSLLEKYDFSDYEIFHPNDCNDILKYKEIIFELNSKNLSSTSVLTPNIQILFHNYLDFAINYGDPILFTFVKYRPTNEIIAAMTGYINPFQKNFNDKYNSFVIFSIVVDKKYRKKGIGWFMIKRFFNGTWEKGYRYFSSPVESNAKITQIIARKLGLEIKRTHLILEMNL